MSNCYKKYRANGVGLWDPRVAGGTMPEPIINHGYFTGSSGLGLWDPRVAAGTMPEPRVNRAYVPGVVYDAARDDYPQLRNPPGISAQVPTMQGLGSLGYAGSCGCPRRCGCRMPCRCSQFLSGPSCGCSGAVAGLLDDAWSAAKSAASSATSWVGDKASAAADWVGGTSQSISTFVLSGLNALCDQDAQNELKKMAKNRSDAAKSVDKLVALLQKLTDPRQKQEAANALAKAREVVVGLKKAEDWAYSWVGFGLKIGVPACEKFILGTPTTTRGAVKGLGVAAAVAVAPAVKLVVLGVGLVMGAAIVTHIVMVNKVATDQLAGVNAVAAALNVANAQVKVECDKDASSEACKQAREYALKVTERLEKATDQYVATRKAEGQNSLGGMMESVKVVAIAGAVGLIAYYGLRPILAKRRSRSSGDAE